MYWHVEVFNNCVHRSRRQSADVIDHAGAALNRARGRGFRMIRVDADLRPENPPARKILDSRPKGPAPNAAILLLPSTASLPDESTPRQGPKFEYFPNPSPAGGVAAPPNPGSLRRPKMNPESNLGLPSIAAEECTFAWTQFQYPIGKTGKLKKGTNMLSKARQNEWPPGQLWMRNLQFLGVDGFHFRNAKRSKSILRGAHLGALSRPN